MKTSLVKPAIGLDSVAQNQSETVSQYASNLRLWLQRNNRKYCKADSTRWTFELIRLATMRERTTISISSPAALIEQHHGQNSERAERLRWPTEGNGSATIEGFRGRSSKGLTEYRLKGLVQACNCYPTCEPGGRRRDSRLQLRAFDRVTPCLYRICATSCCRLG